jgi:hypothetical protein
MVRRSRAQAHTLRSQAVLGTYFHFARKRVTRSFISGDRAIPGVTSLSEGL